MKALVWHGKSNVPSGTVPDAAIEEPRDIIADKEGRCIKVVLKPQANDCEQNRLVR